MGVMRRSIHDRRQLATLLGHCRSRLSVPLLFSVLILCGMVVSSAPIIGRERPRKRRFEKLSQPSHDDMPSGRDLEVKRNRLTMNLPT
jgi:hypothetical protein